jgi:UTP--glucose-1-phosphate uridylyltransferase
MPEKLPTTKIRTGVIAAGGAASRLYPGSKVFVKELLPLPRLPAIALVILEMVQAGLEHICIVVRKDNSQAVQRLLDPSITPPASVENDPIVRTFEKVIRSTRFSFVEQKGGYGNGTPLIDAMAVSRELPAIYAFADDVVFGENASRRLVHTFGTTGHPVLAAQRVASAEVSKFGILECFRSGGVHYVKRLIEKPAKGETTSRLASLGRYVVNEELVDTLQKTVPGRGGEIWLTDAFGRLLENGSKVAACQLTKGRWHTVGTPGGFVKAVRAGLLAEPAFK